MIVDILGDNSSTRKVKREMREGKYLITSIKDRDGNKEYSRERITEVATKFYKNLYRREEEQTVGEEELEAEKN